MLTFCVNKVNTVFVIFFIIQRSLQNCPEEITTAGTKVKWSESPEDYDVKSDPKCYYNETLITRNCTNDTWIPSIDMLKPCYNNKQFDSLICPPGFKKISRNLNRYCYKISEPSVWNYPCLESGGASIITELTTDEMNFLLTSLNSSGYSYFWLPARREKILAPVVWHIPGPNWGQSVENSEIIPLITPILKKCLLLDIIKRNLITANCNEIHPSLCFYINDLNYPAQCPEGYYAYRHILDDGKCFGLEKSSTGLSYDGFIKNKCKEAMGNDDNFELRAFIFKKIAESMNLPHNEWCWFSSSPDNHNKISLSPISEDKLVPTFRNAINNKGTVVVLNSNNNLSCMACETDIIYDETEFIFEYNSDENKIYLTVFSPSGLWKYNDDDRGVQCFSDARGFFKVIDVYELESEVTNFTSLNYKTFDVKTYTIDLVTDRSARYWCEGHTKNFSLITTNKILVNPLGSKVHVFSLVIDVFICINEIDNVVQLQIHEMIETLSNIFQAEKVLLMDVLDYDNNNNIVRSLLHLHIPINNTYSNESLNLMFTYRSLKEKAIVEFPKHNFTFVNMSSSVYCLPTTSQDSVVLHWALTPIGYITSPKQFCLQSNGLPVYRQCHGSYLLGSFWGEVNGKCDKNYEPSITTTLLFNFVQGNLGNEFTSRFLTTGLEFVFNDTNIIIPADIYYLSVSFQQILQIANENSSGIETGDIDHIAWIMDRLMVLDKNSLHLAQTLNSTNVILDSINNIIGMITKHTQMSLYKKSIRKSYQLAVQPRFVIQISYPYISNITGIALLNLRNSDNFSDMVIHPLFKNTTIEEALSLNDLEVATWLPHYVLDTLIKSNNDTDECDENNNKNSMHILINIYYNDVIFQELNANEYRINSRIIEVSVPGYTTSPSASFSIPLLFGQLRPINMPKICGFWDFHSQIGNISGSWSNRGCSLVANVNNISICECHHLTHFGQLINVNGNIGKDDNIIEDHHRIALNIITLIGSILSLLGITGIWITAIVFDMWRKKTGTKVLLQLSTAIALPLLLIIIFNVDESLFSDVINNGELPYGMQVLCIILGAVFHYSVLANFTWMLITAVLQFIRYVRVLGVSRPSRFMFKITLLGWGIPLIPVIILLLVDRDNYIPNAETKRYICYPSGIYMILSVVVPICIILFINIVLFLLVIKSISKKSEMRITDKSLVCAQLRVSIFLFFLLGLTWIFGVLSFSGSVIWSYFFCITATVQGFVLFIYFVICDPTTRNLWITVVKPQFVAAPRSRHSITTISSG